MKGWPGLIPGIAMLAGCGGADDRDPDAVQGAASTATASATAKPASARTPIGTVSSLSGTRSKLTGAISDFAVRRTETATIATLAADTLFAFDSASIAPSAAENLRRTAALIAQGGSVPIRVVGHTDAKGTDAYNDDLSRRRAQAVADALGAAGTGPPHQFLVEGKGKRQPIMPNTLPDGTDNSEGRMRNRRVEVIIPRQEA